MARFISPAKEQLSLLRQPLTPGEQQVFDFFDQHLHPAWEIYIQPHLNGLRPDFVLLHPQVGIAVFEVKDWNLESMAYQMRSSGRGSPTLLGNRDGKEFSLQNQNPIEKVLLYKQEIEELYCPRLAERAGYVVITAGVIFPYADDDKVKLLLHPARVHHNLLEYPQYFPISGREALHNAAINQVFPESQRSVSRYMDATLASDLRNWLVEPDAPQTQRTPLEFDTNQKTLVLNRTESGYRRIKGPAGSGKSLILAARAAQLASEGKRVLVVTYNITLLHYLRDLSVRWPHPHGITFQNDIVWLNFHNWCKRVCHEAGWEAEYKALWRDRSEGQWDTKNILSSGLPHLVMRILESEDASLVTRYDAVLVDEGQDYLPLWWSALRKACSEGGEMLLVADATQDTYGTAAKWPSGTWTDGSMIGSGFSGPWAKLEFSYRTPPEVTEHARTFAELFLPDALRDVPRSPQLELQLFPSHLRWRQTDKNSFITTCVKEIMNLFKAAEPNHLSVADISFLVTKNEVGRKILTELGRRGIRVANTFAIKPKESRKQKIALYMGDARMKGTTVHSFKGWEARAIVLCIDHARTPARLAAIYSGLTRLKRHPNGSFLTVVCAEQELSQYGQTWSKQKR